jgi:hypothetical protein
MFASISVGTCPSSSQVNFMTKGTSSNLVCVALFQRQNHILFAYVDVKLCWVEFGG